MEAPDTQIYPGEQMPVGENSPNDAQKLPVEQGKQLPILSVPLPGLKVDTGHGKDVAAGVLPGQ